jgi:methylmalonyl-CoA mutase
VPLCDGHDSAVTTINAELAADGAEVIYLGYHCAASTIARAAVQEDAHAVGLSSYNGGHRVFFREVLRQLRERGAPDIPVFGGGGGTITRADERVMRRDGVDRVFFAGTPLAQIRAAIRAGYARELKANPRLTGERLLGRRITLAERGVGAAVAPAAAGPGARGAAMLVVGVAGPGGAGKSTLIDELTSRFLARRPGARVAILANDPTHPGTGGAILGDRVSAIYAQDDRVFFRSLATRGSLSGMSAAAPAVIELLRSSGQFELVLVESVGIGQESDPFGVFAGGAPAVERTVFVLSPHYGGRIQLQKTAMLSGADFVVLNKCDHPMARTASAEVGGMLAAAGARAALFATVASQHDDPGVDRLYEAVCEGAAPVGPRDPA